MERLKDSKRECDFLGLSIQNSSNYGPISTNNSRFNSSINYNSRKITTITTLILTQLKIIFQTIPIHQCRQ